MKKTIAILFHKKRSVRSTRSYVITYLADIWRKDGHKIIFLFGTKKFIPADICIVHIDLSVVPEEYLVFANRYPITLNGKVKDIRKRRFSSNIVRQCDQYQGKVIVKSDQNCAGKPERILLKNPIYRMLSKININLNLSPRRFNSASDYKVYDRASDVPPIYFQDSYFIVEKFLPEKVDNLYFVHLYLFLGDRHQCFKLGSKYPIVNGRSSISWEVVKPDPDIIRMQKEMNFDYGKFDYCLNEGKVVLLDVNKTVGYGGLKYTEQLGVLHRYRAEGLYAYFKKS